MGDYLSKYYELCIRKDLISKYNINNLRLLSELRKITLHIDLPTINSMEDVKITQSIKFLESICGQKSIVEDRGVSKTIRGFSAGWNLKVKVTLRKQRMYSFLSLLAYIVVPLYIKKYGILDLKMSKSGELILVMKDPNVFYNLKGIVSYTGVLVITICVSGKSEISESLLKNIFL